MKTDLSTAELWPVAIYWQIIPPLERVKRPKSGREGDFKPGLSERERPGKGARESGFVLCVLRAVLESIPPGLFAASHDTKSRFGFKNLAKILSLWCIKAAETERKDEQHWKKGQNSLPDPQKGRLPCVCPFHFVSSQKKKVKNKASISSVTKCTIVLIWVFHKPKRDLKIIVSWVSPACCIWYETGDFQWHRLKRGCLSPMMSPMQKPLQLFPWYMWCLSVYFLVPNIFHKYSLICTKWEWSTHRLSSALISGPTYVMFCYVLSSREQHKWK